MNRSDPKWRLKKGVAEIRWRQFDLEVDVHKPSQGIALAHPELDQCQQLFGTPQVIVLPNEKLDPYSQNGNLIVPYPCTDDRIFGGELSWRVQPFIDHDSTLSDETDESDDDVRRSSSTYDRSPNTLTIELVYSTQTLLLDTHPQPQIESRLIGNSIDFFSENEGDLIPCTLNDRFIACLTHNKDLATLITVMPSDLVSCSVVIGDLVNGQKSFVLTWVLTADFLEKGVIRRFRAFSAAGPDSEVLLDAARSFYHSEIPLTA